MPMGVALAGRLPESASMDQRNSATGAGERTVDRKVSLTLQNSKRTYSSEAPSGGGAFIEWPRQPIRCLKGSAGALEVYAMDQLPVAEQFVRMHHHSIVVYSLKHDPRATISSTSNPHSGNTNNTQPISEADTNKAPSIYLSFQLRHTVHHVPLSWLVVKRDAGSSNIPNLAESSQSTDAAKYDDKNKRNVFLESKQFAQLSELLRFCEELEDWWLPELAAWPEFIDQPFEGVDVQRELQFRPHLVLLKQKYHRVGEYQIVFYKQAPGSRKIQQRTISINFQKNSIKDDRRSGTPKSFLEVANEMASFATQAPLTARLRLKRRCSTDLSIASETFLKLPAHCSHAELVHALVWLRNVVVVADGGLDDRNFDTNPLVLGLVHRLCAIPFAESGYLIDDHGGKFDTSRTCTPDQNVHIIGAEVLEDLCSWRGEPLCKFLWLALLNQMQFSIHQGTSLGLVHLLVVCGGKFADFFFAWRPIGLLSSLYVFYF